MQLRSIGTAALAAGAIILSAGQATAAAILPGLYRLHNHPDGNQRPPLYGARFDELYNATGGHDVFTLDFDHIQSAMYMTINAAQTEIRIFGQSVGGRDTGTTYAADSYLGLYQVDFTYTLGVGPVVGDDDLQVVEPDMRNSGSIVTPLGDSIGLTDKAMGGYSFRFGDENNDAGHRGFNGLSGWGWMNYVTADGVLAHIESTDWLFTATYEIPTPGAAALAGVSGLLCLRRRRR
ncbi:MAG: hypothetical protein IT438_13465 [Phycisphaerales bacterium]|nr:hypothetical protein [Phycisphaerales bacterium]